MPNRLPFYTLLSAVFCGTCLPLSILFWCQRGMPPMSCDVKSCLCGAVFVVTLIVSGVAQFLFTRESWSVCRQNIALLLPVSCWHLPYMALGMESAMAEGAGRALSVLSGSLLCGLFFCWPAVGPLLPDASARRTRGGLHSAICWPGGYNWPSLSVVFNVL